MPRVSQAARNMLEVVTPDTVEVVRRIRPPLELTEEQTGEFNRLVSQMPAEHFFPGCLALVTQLSRHVIMARRLAQLIERAIEDPASTPHRIEQLRVAQHSESSLICRIMTQLRLTPQSVTPSRTTTSKVHEAQNPWSELKSSR